MFTSVFVPRFSQAVGFLTGIVTGSSLAGIRPCTGGVKGREADPVLSVIVSSSASLITGELTADRNPSTVGSVCSIGLV